LSEAAIADLGALAAAVNGSGNPDSRPVFIVNPKQSIRLRCIAPELASDIITSGHQPIGSVGCIDSSAVALLVSLPEFQLSRSAALHMEGASPLPLSTTGTPNVVSAPIVSLFQQDQCALRTVLRTGWAKRRSGCTALATTVAW